MVWHLGRWGWYAAAGRANTNLGCKKRKNNTRENSVLVEGFGKYSWYLNIAYRDQTQKGSLKRAGEKKWRIIQIKLMKMPLYDLSD